MKYKLIVKKKNHWYIYFFLAYLTKWSCLSCINSIHTNTTYTLFFILFHKFFFVMDNFYIKSSSGNGIFYFYINKKRNASKVQHMWCRIKVPKTRTGTMCSAFTVDDTVPGWWLWLQGSGPPTDQFNVWTKLRNNIDLDVTCLIIFCKAYVSCK